MKKQTWKAAVSAVTPRRGSLLYARTTLHGKMAAALALACAGALAGSNLITNGGFDGLSGSNQCKWECPTGWSSPDPGCIGWVNGHGGVYLDGVPDVGTAAMMLWTRYSDKNPEWASNSFYQDVSVATPGTYRYSFRYVSAHATAWNGCDATTEITLGDIPLLSLTTDTYQEIKSYLGAVEVSAAGTYRFQLSQTTSSERGNVFDDIVLARCDENEGYVYATPHSLRIGEYSLSAGTVRETGAGKTVTLEGTLSVGEGGTLECPGTLILNDGVTLDLSSGGNVRTGGLQAQSAGGPAPMVDVKGGTLTLLCSGASSAGRFATSGGVSLGAGSKIVFDTTDATVMEVRFTAAGGFDIPEGAELEGFVEVSDPARWHVEAGEGYVAAVINPIVPVSAVWQGAGFAASASAPANWRCYNSRGELLEGDVLPGTFTTNLTLEADCDLRAPGGVAFGDGVKVDLNGHGVKVGDIAALLPNGSVTNSAAALSAVTVDVASGEVANSTVALLGNIKLVKDGGGTFTAAKVGQTYTGGTDVLDGTLKSSMHGWDRGLNDDTWPFGRWSTNLVYNGSFDLDESQGWSGARGWECHSGGANNWVGVQPSDYSRVGGLNVGKFALVISGRAGNGESTAAQTIQISEPGTYRLSFQYAASALSAERGNTTDVMLVHGGETNVVDSVTPSAHSFSPGYSRVLIGEPGAYTLVFRNRALASGADKYNLFDNVELVRLSDIALTGENAVFDVGGKYWLYHYRFVLDGGTLRNTVDESSASSKIQSVLLRSDSTFDMRANYALWGEGATRSYLELGGNTLTLAIGNGKTFTLNSAAVSDGRVVIPSTTGTLKIDSVNVSSGTVSAADVDFEVGSALDVVVPFVVRDYVANYSGADNAGAASIEVHGAFRPTVDRFHGVTLADGSTLDLREWPETAGWPVASRFAGGATNIQFAADAAVTVEVPVRRDLKRLALSDAPYILTWDSEPQGVAFTPGAASSAARFRVVKDPVGLRLWYPRGTVIVVK